MRADYYTSHFTNCSSPLRNLEATKTGKGKVIAFDRSVVTRWYRKLRILIMKKECRNAVLNLTPVTVCLLDNNKVLTLLNSYRQVCLPPPYPTFLLRPSVKRDKSTCAHVNLLDITKRIPPAEYFWRNSSLDSWWNTVSGVWYIFSIETKNKE